ncbi:DUF6077 domain-containing protein [Enterococcus sp. CWB-B31]|uniref:DUF6077 domain-containing protein n=1 Tax=Enterococcus sp. CWB-B31 TaxID=2885159 RepID=UPI001E50FB47|nr:DUF6077 domain-containing protein [Enterococcus sp. CWB-B31]MCB5953474.1 DUF6077 domain-containing protein [Enterococcus sp. CWB-B31]
MSGLNVLLIGKMILFYLMMTVIMYMTGSGVCRRFGINAVRIERLSIGFVFHMALIQLFGWFFVAFRWPMSAFILQVIFISFFGIILGISREAYKAEKRKIEWSGLIVLGILLFQITLLFIMYRSDADDSFYVSNVTLFQNSQNLNLYDGSFGNPLLGTVPMYDFEIWEAYMAFFCKLLQIDGATMLHFVLVPWLLVVSASAYLFLGRILFDGDERKGNYFYILLSVFHLMGGYEVFSQGSFLLSRIWQGKAVYLHIVLPVMMGLLLSCVSHKKELDQTVEKTENKLFVLLFACILAGAGLNPTSLYVLGFQLAAMLLALAIYKRKAKLLLHAFPAVITVLFFTLLVYLRARQFSGQLEAASEAADNFVFATFKSFFGSGMLYFYIYILAVFIILAIGNTRAKISFVLTPIILFIGVWNPLTGKLVAETLTKVPSFWRVFWLIPVGLAVSYTLVLIAGYFKSGFIGLLVSCVIIALPGQWMFLKENNFVRANNVERLPTEVMQFGNRAIEEKDNPVILGTDEFATTFRQKYDQIELIYSRHQYILDLFVYRDKEEEGTERIALMDFSRGLSSEEEKTLALLKKYSVDYVVLENNHTESRYILENNNWHIVDKSEEYLMYSRRD